MNEANILVVDDNPEILEILTILLEGENYTVFSAQSGAAALSLLAAHSIDLIILDVMMPEMNGYQTCLKIRELSNAPLLFLSARSKESDKTLGFSSGGDDYLTKPFSYNELLSRTKALLRRYQIYRGKDAAPLTSQEEPSAKTVTRHGICVCEKDRTVFLESKKIDLTETEYSLFSLLFFHPGQIFSAAHLYEAVWQEPYYYGANNTVMVHIRNLRRKLEQNPNEPVYIKTVWGKGYCFD